MCLCVCVCTLCMYKDMSGMVLCVYQLGVLSSLPALGRGKAPTSKRPLAVYEVLGKC